MNAIAIARFLEVLGVLVVMKNGGEDNDLSKLLHYARLGVRAGDTGTEHLKAAVAKVEQLVVEDRNLTDAELAFIDASIKDKLARAAAVNLQSSPDTGSPVVEPHDNS